MLHDELCMASSGAGVVYVGAMQDATLLGIDVKMCDASMHAMVVLLSSK